MLAEKEHIHYVLTVYILDFMAVYVKFINISNTSLPLSSPVYLKSDFVIRNEIFILFSY